MSYAIRNPRRIPGASSAPPDQTALAFHRMLPDYAPTTLHDAPVLAALLQVGRVSVKNEAHRFGLPAFKALGAFYAAFRALSERLGRNEWPDWNAFKAAVATLKPFALACATDGNHGRAVARFARLLDLEARIFVPAGTATARVDAIMDEGARVTVVHGSYDDAVARAAHEAGERCLVIADTAWEGYEDVPRWVSSGYGTMLWEIDQALAERHAPAPDVVAIQIGVGALASAVVRHYRRAALAEQPRILGVEPTDAACVLASIQAGEMVALPGEQHSIMAGLNCGTPSPLAWPIMRDGIDAFMAIDDDWARRGMRALAAAGIVSGETGAAGIGGLLALAAEPALRPVRDMLNLHAHAHVLVLSTEGATDPAAYQAIINGA